MIVLHFNTCEYHLRKQHASILPWQLPASESSGSRSSVATTSTRVEFGSGDVPSTPTGHEKSRRRQNPVMDFVHVGLLNISPVDIRRLAFYLVIRIYSSATNAMHTLSTTRLNGLLMKVNTPQVKSYSTLVFDARQGKLLHAIL